MTRLTIDLETHKPEGFVAKKKKDERPDFRIDEVDRFGWLADGADTAYWSEDACPMPMDIREYRYHNGVYDHGILHRLDPINFPLHNIDIEDTMALAYSLGEEDLSLKGLMQKHLGVNTVTYTQQELIGTDQYHAQDLWGTRNLHPKLMERQRGRAYDIDRALIPALIDMSFRGYVIDHERLDAGIAQAEQTRDRCQAQFDKLMFGEEVLKSRRKKVTKARGLEYVEKFGPPDIGSPKQLQQFFMRESADEETLKEIEHHDANDQAGQAAMWIRKYRKSNTLLTRYFYPNQEKDTLTGLFNLTPQDNEQTGGMDGGTEGGRLSSERDNMQNQPPEMQRILRAPEGFTILHPDYSQIELRFAAEVSQDPYLLEVFKPGSTRDLHMETRDFFRPFLPGWCNCGPVKCIHRDQAKRFNFGVLYFGGPMYLASVMGVSYAVAEMLLNVLREQWAVFFAWAERHWLEVQRHGKSMLPEPICQIRNVPLVGNIEHSKKLAINHPIQGSAGYLMKHAQTRLSEDGFLLANQIHDASPLFVQDDIDLELPKARIREIMEGTAREYLPTVGGPVEIKDSVYWRD
ncbi:hypothetical protein LCGC14_0657640 [marine sediment metagenome]|uniref:DNA-directed DNA polymerase n=1 Tax=marine sediment metagenome TaxID=412755 RepID=A0A0F9QUI9_9ZZZZ